HHALVNLGGDTHGVFCLDLRNTEYQGFVPNVLQMADDAVVRGVQTPADEPLPEGRVAGVERRVPVVIPAEEIGVLLEALRKMFLAESVEKRRVRTIGLGDERGRRVEVILLLPVSSDLRLGDLSLLPFCHRDLPLDSDDRISASKSTLLEQASADAEFIHFGGDPRLTTEGY